MICIYVVKSASEIENREASWCFKKEHKALVFEGPAGSQRVSRSDWVSDMEANMFRGFASQIWGLINTLNKSCPCKLTLKTLSWRKLTNSLKGAIDGRKKKDFLLTRGGHGVHALLGSMKFGESKSSGLLLSYVTLDKQCTFSRIFICCLYQCCFKNVIHLGIEAHVSIVFSWSNSLLKELACFFLKEYINYI